jgi:hypothetical protein
MLAVEREFSAAIYCLYLVDCLHWLKPGQAALTRRITGGWKRWEHREESFTLLGRMPVFANVFDLRPGWIVGDAQSLLPENLSAQEIDDFLDKQFPRWKFLLDLSILAALNLLVLLPGLLIDGSLAVLWPAPALLLFTHAAIAIEVFAQSKKWRAADKAGFWREYFSMLLNPVAALRCGDLLLEFSVRAESGGASPPSPPQE